jgi:hypothetical protein
MVLLGVKAEVEACFGLFRDNANLMQDRCTVCTEHTIGSKIILAHPIELLGDMGVVESDFSPFGNGVSVGVR